MNTPFAMRALRFVDRHCAGIAGVLIAVVVVGGVLYSFLLGTDLRYPDELGYCLLSSHLVSEHLYSFDGAQVTAFLPPGYPLLLASLRVLGADILVFRVVNFFILGVSMHLVYRILTERSTRVSGVVGVLLVMGYPVLFYTAGTLYAQTLATCLLLGVFRLSGRGEVSWPATGLRGILMGLLVLTVPIFLIALAVLAVWHLVVFRRRGIVKLAGSLLIAAGVVGSWSLRNYVAFGAIIPVSTNSGLNLLRGNSSHATANSGVNVPIDEYMRAAETLDEVEQDRFYRARALEFVRENKTKALKLYWLKFLNHFNYRNELYARAEGSSIRDIIMLVTYVPLLVLLVVRLALFKRWRVQSWEWLFLSTYVLSGLAYAVFFTRIRFRVPFDLLLICLVAHLIGSVVHEWWGGREVRLGDGEDGVDAMTGGQSRRGSV